MFEGQEGYDIAATAQRAFEVAFFSVLDRYDNDVLKLVIIGILTGGLLILTIPLFVVINDRACGWRLSAGRYSENRRQI